MDLPLSRRVSTEPLSRRWLWVAAAAALILTFAQSPGQISPDTKLDLTANPLRFLARAFNLWNSELPFGQAQNQTYGYLFPHGAFFLAGDMFGLPGWVTQRLWWALLLTVGFWGLLRVAEALGIGSPTSRVIAAAAFALSPRVLITLGAISSETLPMMLAPWVLLPVILALRAQGQVRVMAARSAVAIALMGAVNAVATLTGCLAAAIWLACHRPNRLWWRFTAWWALCIVLAVLWWVVALFMLGRISPPFLDFIESSGVTTQWMSLTEMLRGTDAWTPFVAPNATAGASLVTGSVAVLATTLVAAAGMAGLAMRTMPARGRLIVILLIGVVLLAVGYSGGLGSPVAQQVQTFLDAGGTPLRNMHKLEPLLRLPLVLGLAHLLGRIPLPGSTSRREWMQAFAHPERDKRVAVGVVVLVALAAATSLAWTGRLTPPGAFDAIPQYWHDTADWLDEHNNAGGRVLVAPGAPFATQVWGTSHDEPLQVLGSSPWGVRDSIPLTPPETIRALDSVQRLFAAGRPSAGLADTLAQQGISYVVVRNDLDPESSRSARPLLVHRARPARGRRCCVRRARRRCRASTAGSRRRRRAGSACQSRPATWQRPTPPAPPPRPPHACRVRGGRTPASTRAAVRCRATGFGPIDVPARAPAAAEAAVRVCACCAAGCRPRRGTPEPGGRQAIPVHLNSRRRAGGRRSAGSR